MHPTPYPVQLVLFLCIFVQNFILLPLKCKVKLSCCTNGGTENPAKRITVDRSHKQPHDFGIDKIQIQKKLFVYCVTDSFLAEDPETWATNEDYLKGEVIVRNLRVVNDAAKCGVALMHDYNALLTKDEEQMQFALQVVKKHRKHFPDAKKSTLLQGSD